MCLNESLKAVALGTDKNARIGFQCMRCDAQIEAEALMEQEPSREALERLMFKVHDMREMQKAYFARKMEYHKKQSIRLEKEVDDMIKQLQRRGYELKPPPASPTQGSLI